MSNPKIKSPRVLIYVLLVIIIALFGVIFLILRPK